MPSRKTRINAKLREAAREVYPDFLDEDRILAECEDSDWRADFGHFVGTDR